MTSINMRNSFDFIIVGGGSAGCVLANRLSACGRFHVALIEAGPAATSPFSTMPGGVARFMHSRRFNWLNRSSDPAPLRAGSGLYAPRGKGLGGSSAINAMIYTRGLPSDYNRWAETAGEHWNWEHVLPVFKRLESNTRGANAYHGADGPLHVSDVAPHFAVAKAFLQAAQEAGYPLNPDFNGETLEGFGPFQFTIKNGERFSAKRAFLEPVVDRVNLHILSDTAVEKILFNSSGEAQGIQIRQGKRVSSLTATREVLLSAGAFNSPQLLLLSGVGPREQLHSHGIEVVEDRQEVGANLQEHVDITVHVRNKKRDTISLNPLGLLQLAGQTWKYWRHRKGAMAHPPCEVGGFIKSNEQQAEPDLQLHLVSTLFNDSGYDLTPALRYGFSCHVCVLRPQARGTLTLASSDPRQPPRIQFNFLDNEADQKALIAGVRQVQQIMQKPALASHYGGELMPGQFDDDEELLAQLQRHCGLIYHPTSTCRMGLDADSVVDEKLRVRGVQKLRVIDASVMPQVISGNTNAPTMMIAEQAADFILADHS